MNFELDGSRSLPPGRVRRHGDPTADSEALVGAKRIKGLAEGIGKRKTCSVLVETGTRFLGMSPHGEIASP